MTMPQHISNILRTHSLHVECQKTCQNQGITGELKSPSMIMLENQFIHQMDHQSKSRSRFACVMHSLLMAPCNPFIFQRAIPVLAFSRVWQQFWKSEGSEICQRCLLNASHSNVHHQQLTVVADTFYSTSQISPM